MREQVKARLKAEGKWQAFVGLREKLKANGMKPAQAWAEALQHVDSQPPLPAADGSPTAANPEPAPQLSDDFDATLAVMKHVVSKPASADTTIQQATYRTWLRNDPKGFLGKQADLERAEAEKGRAAESAKVCLYCGTKPGESHPPRNPRLEELLKPELEIFDDWMQHYDEFMAWKKDNTATKTVNVKQRQGSGR